MKRFMMTAALAAFAFAGAASAQDIDALKAEAVGACKKEMDGAPVGDIDKLCGCMVDNIVTVFGDDADEMLKVVISGHSPGDTAEIAALLGISEEEATAFVKTAEERMSKVQEACVPAE